jgi:uncharacterized protein (TIGR02996 family)
MAHAEAFLAAIREAPDDDTPRLVFADWLDEHGDAARAEFIRAQCELAGGGGGRRRERLLRRERELLLEHEHSWLGPLASLVRRATFVRGFVERVTVLAEQLLKHASALFAAAPVRHLILTECRDLLPILALPELRAITTLDLRAGCHPPNAQELWALLDAPHLLGVTALILRQRGLGNQAAEALVVSPSAARLRTLDLYDSGLDRIEFRRLARCPFLAGLTTLVLGGNGELGNEGMETIRGPDCRFNELRRLHLSFTGVTNAGAAALAGASCLGRLQDLNLRGNTIDDAGARALANSPHLAGLARLNLTDNPIARRGRRVLERRFGESVRL